MSLQTKVKDLNYPYTAFTVNKIPDPVVPPTIALIGATPGNVNNDDYTYAVAFQTSTGDLTLPTGNSNKITVANNAVAGQISITNITQPTDASITLINLYRKGINVIGTYELVVQLTVGTTTYTDNLANSSLIGTAPSTVNTTGNLTTETLAITKRGAFGNAATFLPTAGGIDKIFDFTESITDLSTGPNGFNPFNVSIDINSSANYASDINGCSLTVQTDVASTANYGFIENQIGVQHQGSGTVTEILGAFLFAEHTGSGAASNVKGFISDAIVDGGGTATNLIGFQCGAQIYSGAVTNSYGARITSNPTPASATNIIGLLIEDQSGAATLSLAMKVVKGLSLFQDDIQTTGRLMGSAGVATAANNLTLPANNVVVVSGTTTINAITILPWVAGCEVTLIFAGIAIVKHNTAGGAGTGKMFLNLSVDLVTAPNTVLKLVFDGTQFQEVSRKVA